MFTFPKNIFNGLLASVLNASNHYLTNQKCTTEPTVVNLHANEYTQGLYYFH